MYLFLDDERVPSDVTWDRDFPHSKLWTIVRNIDQFKSTIDAHLPKIKHVAFDHDLGPQHYPWNDNKHDDGKTGFDCAKYLVDQCMNYDIPLPSYSVHSMNPVGRENIISYLENYRSFSK